MKFFNRLKSSLPPVSYPLEIDGLRVEVVRKKIKNLNLRVYPPDGQVRVTAPWQLDDAAVCQAVTARLVWIRRKQAEIAAQPRRPEYALICGEIHYVWGESYRLNLIETSAANRVELGDGRIDLYVLGGSDFHSREALLASWHRGQLKKLVPELLAKWQPVIGVQVADWGIRKMKTRWGSCNIGAQRVWLNLELAKKPLSCVEYVLVHELVHLHERYHNERFYRLMTQFLPQWRRERALLNQIPVAEDQQK